jgi:hypothetical protein
MPNFNELLQQDPSKFERRPVVPEGEWLAVIKSKEFGTSAKKKTPLVTFTFGLVSPMPSVPQAALEGFDISKAKMQDDFYFTEDAMFRLKEFFETVGCTQSSTGDSIEAAIGQQVIISVGHSPNEREPSRPYANITGYASARAA